jgi:ribonuclease BN (tRNA processing enzyme)
MPSRLPGLLLITLTALLCATADDARSAASTGPALSLLVLGSGGPGATGRAGAGYVVLLDGRARILVDAGPGTFARAGEAGVDLGEVQTVLLTHLHADHATELPGLVKARAVAARSDIAFDIYGPPASGVYPSTTRFVDLLLGPDGAFAYLRDFAGHLTILAHDVERSTEPRILMRDGALTLSAIAGHHGEAPSVVYRVDYGGRSITFTGDIDASGHDALARLAKDTSLLVFDAVVLDPPGSPPALYALHTAPRDIGRLAREAHAGKLLLSHLNPAIDRAQTAVRASIRESYKGPVEFARDGLAITP